MMHPWSDLRWWNSGERQVVEERIDDLSARGIHCCPEKNLYKALSSTSLGQTRVAIIGQDPYPTQGLATGVAFSVSKELQPKAFPPTLRLLLGEWHADLKYDLPDHGCLDRWCAQGVLLWNAIPSCQSGRSLSNDWDEWSYLTREIVQRLSEKGIVFAFLGTVAGRFNNGIDLERNRVVTTSHPSPRGNQFGRHPFTGSRLFSTINARLAEISQPAIDWRIDDERLGKGDIQGPELGGGTVLQNITGAKLGGLKRQGTSPNIYTSLAF